MKTIKNDLNESPVATFGVICLFSGIVVTALSLAVFMLKNIDLLSTSFNF